LKLNCYKKQKYAKNVILKRTKFSRILIKISIFTEFHKKEFQPRSKSALFYVNKPMAFYTFSLYLYIYNLGYYDR